LFLDVEIFFLLSFFTCGIVIDEVMSMWLDTFNEMRKNSKMSLDEISLKSGVPKSTLAKITSGITKAPPLETMRKLVYSMGYTLDDLDKGLAVSENFSKEEKEHIKKYRSLDEHGKEAVDAILDVEWRRCTQLAPALGDMEHLFIQRFHGLPPDVQQSILEQMQAMTGLQREAPLFSVQD